MPVFTTHDEQGRKSVNFAYISGMPAPWREGAPVNLTIDEKNNRLIIRSRAFDWPPASMPFSRIFNVELFSEDEVVEKNKSVVKRGIAGALIAGPVGAIVGGMSGIGTKAKTRTRRGLAIDFETKSGDRSLIFEIVGATYDPQGFAAELNRHVAGMPHAEKAKKNEAKDKPKYDVIIPERLNGAPREYVYHVNIELLDRNILEQMDADNSWDLIPELVGETIMLKNRGSILGRLLDRVDMLSDWMQRGDPYIIVLEHADESQTCKAVLAFYRDKRKYWSYREQTVVSLKRCRSDEAQEEIRFCESGDKLDVEEGENGSACVYRFGEIIGRLPAAVAKRYFEEDAEGIFFESAQEDDGGVLTPSVRIYW